MAIHGNHVFDGDCIKGQKENNSFEHFCFYNNKSTSLNLKLLGQARATYL